MIREFIQNKTSKKSRNCTFRSIVFVSSHNKVYCNWLFKQDSLKRHINERSMHDKRKLPKSTKSFVDRAVFVSCNILRKVNYLQPISHETGILWRREKIGLAYQIDNLTHNESWREWTTKIYICVYSWIDPAMSKMLRTDIYCMRQQLIKAPQRWTSINAS